LQNTNKCHGSPLNGEQIRHLRENLDYHIPPFVIHENVYEDVANVIKKRGKKAEQAFNYALQNIESKDLQLYNQFISLSNKKFNWSYS